jgi:hypothetical protein
MKTDNTKKEPDMKTDPDMKVDDFTVFVYTNDT